jgi:hypothetical protein
MLLLLLVLGTGGIAFCRRMGVRLQRRVGCCRFERPAAATRVGPFHLAAPFVCDVLLTHCSMDLRPTSGRDPLEAHPATARRHDINVHG